MKSTEWMLVLGAAALAAACAKKEVPVQEDVRPVRSTVVAATEGSVGASYSGQVRARYESKLGFQTSGRVVARLVDVGSAVKRGQVLMRLDPAQETLHVVSAVADVEAARSRVAELGVDLQRTEQLLARQFASQAELDKQRQALAEAESQLKSALARQQIKVNQRGYTEVVADRDGVVTAIGAEVGQVVSPGQAVVTVAAKGEREVVVSVPESRVVELQQAKVLQVSVWAQPHKRYEGALREMAPDTDSVTRTYSARIAVKDADAALMLGMTASVFTPDVDGSTAIRLPLTAILNKDGRSLVWVVDGASSRVAPKPVELGGAQNDSVIVARGLAGGETVVTAGVHMLHDGQKVALLSTGANDLAPVARPEAAATASKLAQGARP
jgi:membrane fusion protein, multidrug efflux system